jgi:pimeloyl-ACP methyl ester carboxylesterase
MRISLPAKTQDPEDKSFATSECHTNAVIPANPTDIEEHWIDLNEGRMRYLKAGSGPALILIHGLMGYSFSWRFTIPALVPHATIYAVDNLGAGFSNAREGMDCSVRATAERILEFADRLEITKFDLLGTSHGGGVAIMAAAISAERSAKRRDKIVVEPEDVGLRRLVLVAPVNPWSSHGKRLAPFFGGPLGSLLFRHTAARSRSLQNLGLRRLFGDGARIPPDSLEGYREPLLKNQILPHGLRIIKGWTSDLVELQEALPKIRNYPTLIMWGTKDGAVQFQSAEPMYRNFRDVRLVAFEGVGHLPYEEGPDDFNRALVDFLVSTDPFGGTASDHS